MSTMWVEESDLESTELEGAELYDDAAEEDGEESREARRRREQQRRVALARRRQAQARAPAAARARPSAMPSTQQRTVAAIRDLDLETKVQDDSFRSALRAQSKRMSRSEYAAVAGAATNQFIQSFDAPHNAYAQAGLRFAPLLLLSPQKRGTGLEAIVTDPRVVGAAAVAIITFAGENRNRGKQAQSIEIQAPDSLAENAQDQLLADVLDGHGRVIATDVKWSSTDPAVVTVDEKTGEVSAHGRTGTAVVSATFDGVVRRVRLTVT